MRSCAWAHKSFKRAAGGNNTIWRGSAWCCSLFLGRGAPTDHFSDFEVPQRPCTQLVEVREQWDLLFQCSLIVRLLFPIATYGSPRFLHDSLIVHDCSPIVPHCSFIVPLSFPIVPLWRSIVSVLSTHCSPMFPHCSPIVPILFPIIPLLCPNGEQEAQ